MKNTLAQYMLVLVTLFAMLAFITFAKPIGDIINKGVKEPVITALDNMIEQRENGPDFNEGQPITNHIQY